MSYDLAVKITDVSKLYKLYDRPEDRLKQFFSSNKNKFNKEFWALKNVDLTVNRGETIGLIGKNGSGKSTLLQIIVGTLQPSSGSVDVNGRVSALLELGSGFNPDFTGRENIIMNSAILGLNAEEIKEKLPDIISFSGIEKFIDQPVKSYSSGMFVRLAFACAINVNPDILIIDEALAVGDIQFQLKCIEKMKEFKKQGKTIIFVSHDLYSIKNFCDQAIWMMDGQIHMRGDVHSVSNSYENFMKTSPSQHTEEEEIEEDQQDDVLKINGMEFYDTQFSDKKRFNYGEKLSIVVNYTLKKKVEGIVGGIALYDSQDNYICGLNTKLDKFSLPSEPGDYQLALHYEQMNLLPGSYFVDVGFFESSGIVRLDYKKKMDFFTISTSEYFAEGITCIPHNWNSRKEA
ncbi:ABC transporter ATP-binding protein [Paenibacillus chitinolyticus]|uniref:ABC transporter ATP-binding protein n=1 Tax=Paenibacillus chitinolyticus TaxID=79263 RepID=A0A410WRX0_9BACL|nr:ABC transporter ATP-binding protein [Paenibacillus chitinolyticus]MCY9592023.1 ABC transporter ATP-binding protein [Paenibacillus chitinolyticus]MCY9598880.1 ABC transporter ATP-binding protein [Paenibacillus chitinolyticus]QAV17081.1 ABC transporter ATP-binding protein [Paenibacillus chitinolyticus]